MLFMPLLNILMEKAPDRIFIQAVQVHQGLKENKDILNRLKSKAEAAHAIHVCL